MRGKLLDKCPSEHFQSECERRKSTRLTRVAPKKKVDSNKKYFSVEFHPPPTPPTKTCRERKNFFENCTILSKSNRLSFSHCMHSRGSEKFPLSVLNKNDLILSVLAYRGILRSFDFSCVFEFSCKCSAYRGVARMGKCEQDEGWK